MGNVGLYSVSKTKKKGKNGSMLLTQLPKKTKSKTKFLRKTELADKKPNA